MNNGKQDATVSVMTDDYFAGLFDGEGTLRISFNGAQYQLFASLGMTDRRPVEAMKKRFGGWIEVRENAGTNWRPVFIWRASSKGAMVLTTALTDKLLVKKEHALVAAEFQALLTHRTPKVTPEKHALYERMKELNTRGR